jgi:hypothetical protein
MELIMTNNAIRYASPIEAIANFYNAVNAQAYNVAFDCLSDGFKGRIWGHHVDSFADGYKNLQEIKLLDATEISDDAENAQYKIYYKEQKLIHTHPVFDALYNSTFKTPDETAEKMRDVRQLVLELGGEEQNLDEKLTRHAFKKDGVDTILWLSNVHDISQDDRFKTEEYHGADYRRGLLVNTPDAGWKIDGLRYQ